MDRGLVVGLVVGAALGGMVGTLWALNRVKRKRSAKRFGGVCRLRPEKYELYTQLHDHTWDEVMERMYKSNMRNFLVYYHKGLGLLFSHFEYVGEYPSDFDKDMAQIAADPIVKKWWSFCEPCQEPLNWSGPPPSQGGTGNGGQWWAELELINSCGAWPVEYSSAWPDPDFVPKNPQQLRSSSNEPPVLQ